MNRPPFNLKTILFDLLVLVATFTLAELFAIMTAGFIKHDWNEALEFSLYIVVPFWTVLFYLIRRRFNARLTFIQIILTTFTTLTLTYLLTILLNYLPDFVTYEMGYAIPIFATTILLLTKHTTDKFILRKHSNI
jgi:hypothetical protein